MYEENRNGIILKKTLILVQEYVPMTLEQFFKIHDYDLHISKILPILKGIGTGLSFLLKNLIVHRDIKINNILVYEDGRPIISDLGHMAKLNDNKTLRMSDVDSPGGNKQHLAPEVLNSFEEQKKKKYT